MYIISSKNSDNQWLYLSETSVKKTEGSLNSNRTYSFSPNIREAKFFESGEEAKIFWKVSKDKKLLPDFSIIKDNLAIRKIIFKTEKAFQLS